MLNLTIDGNHFAKRFAHFHDNVAQRLKTFSVSPAIATKGDFRHGSNN